MQTNEQFDLIVIGSGPGGYVAAIRAAQLGMKTGIVEREELGGICLNWGCIPTKTLLRSADVLRTIQDADRFGIHLRHAPEPDLAAIVKRSRSVASQLRNGVAALLKKNGVQVFVGNGRLDGANAVLVEHKGESRRLNAKNIVLATGARGRSLPGLTFDGDRVWGYRDALVPSTIPKSMVVIGAGAIGVEFASFYAAIGTEVSLVEAAPRLLPVEDEDISEHLAREFTSRGIQLFTGYMVDSSAPSATGVSLNLRHSGGETQTLQTDVVLVAAGIVGNVENLGLEGTRVRVERSHVVTRDNCETDEPGVFAIGDLAGPPWLAHKASHEGVLCVEGIAGLAVHPLRPEDVPSCTYCHPQVASVGLTERAARDSGANVRVGHFPFAANGKAIAAGSTSGFVKTIFDDDTGELLGAHLIGEEVTELIHGYVIARELETTSDELIQTVFPHPTLSEALHESVLASQDRGLHM